MFRFGLLLLSIMIVGPALGQETSPQAEQKIRDALRGDSPKPTGDGMLDDIIEIVRRRGSILDGSILDGSVLDVPNPASEATGPAPPSPPSIESRAVETRALAAEQLLRAARLLMHAGDADESRRDLVARMRSEAVKLLTAVDPATID